MCLSLFFAQVIGCYLFLVALAMLVHQHRGRKTMHEMAGHPGAVFCSGAFSLIAGLIIVISHNIWVAMWPVLITLVGWFLVAQGLWRLFWPEHCAKCVRDMSSKQGYMIMFWIWLIIGIYLIWMGFSAP